MLEQLVVRNLALPALNHEVAIIHYDIFDRHGIPFLSAS
jgi:hypothetical protein